MMVYKNYLPHVTITIENGKNITLAYDDVPFIRYDVTQHPPRYVFEFLRQYHKVPQLFDHQLHYLLNAILILIKDEDKDYAKKLEGL